MPECFDLLIKRGNEFIIPNGQVDLHEGDKLLYISEKKDLNILLLRFPINAYE